MPGGGIPENVDAKLSAVLIMPQSVSHPPFSAVTHSRHSSSTASVCYLTVAGFVPPAKHRQLTLKSISADSSFALISLFLPLADRTRNPISTASG